MLYFFIGILFLIIVFLLNFLLSDKTKKKIPAAAHKKTNQQCPVCSSFLNQGENLVSRVYRPMDCHDQLCTINGCPHCYPVPQEGIKRVCPVCHKNIPVKDGHLIARLFNKTEGKKHVVVTGCTECCKSGKK